MIQTRARVRSASTGDLEIGSACLRESWRGLVASAAQDTPAPVSGTALRCLLLLLLGLRDLCSACRLDSFLATILRDSGFSLGDSLFERRGDICEAVLNPCKCAILVLLGDLLEARSRFACVRGAQQRALRPTV